jgi:hypothetical protein
MAAWPATGTMAEPQVVLLNPESVEGQQIRAAERLTGYMLDEAFPVCRERHQQVRMGQAVR